MEREDGESMSEGMPRNKFVELYSPYCSSNSMVEIKEKNYSRLYFTIMYKNWCNTAQQDEIIPTLMRRPFDNLKLKAAATVDSDESDLPFRA